ncbi:MAG: hypothetical protein AAGA67_00745, partial [Cyanobacteria bacterium P01_F01_bin.153]
RRNYAIWPKPGPGSWAGSKHFQWQGERLVDPNFDRPVPYLHWAGIEIRPGCPYWETWEDYRYRGEEMPERSPLDKPKPKRSLRDRLRSVKQRIQGK